MTDLSHAQWIKASRSTSNGDNCVEVALNVRAVVAGRDSKNPTGGSLVVAPAQWRRLTGRIRRSEFDL